MHEEFSTLLYNRLHSKLDRRQPPDQEGFRRSFQTLDHLATYRLLGQKSREWGVKMCIATVDFSMAFGHDTSRSTIASPSEIRSRHAIHQPLKKVTRGSASHCHETDTESDAFKIETRTKQGDPLSSLLFNTVLHAALEDDLETWREKGMHGHQFG